MKICEAGGISAFGGIHSRQIVNQSDGTLMQADIKSAIRYSDDHFPPTFSDMLMKGIGKTIPRLFS